MNYAILVVDDEPHMRRLIRIYLENTGYEVYESEDGEVALEYIDKQSIHLVVLDLMMPGMDGWETCAEIRTRQPAIPILMLTARTSVEDKVAGLAMGADDYLTKPFDGRELIARVQALLRRSYPQSELIDLAALALKIDGLGRDVHVKNQLVPLTPKEFDLLLFLAQNKGRSFTRDNLLSRIWGADYDGNTRTVDSHVKNIREKLRDAGIQQNLILTIWGVGYKFEVAP